MEQEHRPGEAWFCWAEDPGVSGAPQLPLDSLQPQLRV